VDVKVPPSDVFKALSVPTRVRIIELLKSESPISVTELAERLGITPAAVSQHLKVLRHAGLVTRERKGYWVPYSIDEGGLEDCCCSVVDVCTCDCHQPGRHGHGAPGNASLERLVEYRNGLKNRLEQLERRIAEFKRKGRR
jgi:DNA-binding transcriptional ArsR family regulator